MAYSPRALEFAHRRLASLTILSGLGAAEIYDRLLYLSNPVTRAGVPLELVCTSEERTFRICGPYVVCEAYSSRAACWSRRHGRMQQLLDS